MARHLKVTGTRPAGRPGAYRKIEGTPPESKKYKRLEPEIMNCDWCIRRFIPDETVFLAEGYQIKPGYPARTYQVCYDCTQRPLDPVYSGPPVAPGP